MALKGVRHGLPVRMQLISPGIFLSGESAAGCKLVFGFGGETLPGPLCIGLGVFVGHLDDWVLLTALQVAALAERVLPTGASPVGPPAELGVQRHGTRGRVEDR